MCFIIVCKELLHSIILFSCLGKCLSKCPFYILQRKSVNFPTFSSQNQNDFSGRKQFEEVSKAFESLTLGNHGLMFDV